MKETEHLQIHNDLVDIVHDAFNDYDDYDAYCHDNDIDVVEDVEDYVADAVIRAGYRKHREGEWLNGVNGSKVCSMCGKEPLYTKSGTALATTFYKVKSNYCPNCGAHMRKEDEGK